MKMLIPMTLLLVASAANAMSENPVIKPTKGPSLCAANEQILWNCTVKGSGKMASLCASDPVTSDAGYVQYRFGTAAQVELSFPQERNHSQQQFTYSRYTRPLETALEVRFTNQDVNYALTSENNQEEEPAIRRSSIDVTNASGKSVSINCVERGTLMNMEDLSPNRDWLQ